MHAPRFDALKFREQFLVWALRIGCSRVTSSDERTFGLLSEGCRRARCMDALSPLLELAAAIVFISHEAQLLPDVRCTCCRFLGADELRALQTIVALQNGDEGTAQRCFAHVPHTGARLLLDHCRAVSVAFAEIGWRFEITGASMGLAARVLH
jgi:hypothetical protein